jgi:hypothetical protein
MEKYYLTMAVREHHNKMWWQTLFMVCLRGIRLRLHLHILHLFHEYAGKRKEINIKRSRLDSSKWKLIRTIATECVVIVRQCARTCKTTVVTLLALKRRRIHSMGHLDRFLIKELCKVIYRTRVNKEWLAL